MSSIDQLKADNAEFQWHPMAHPAAMKKAKPDIVARGEGCCDGFVRFCLDHCWIWRGGLGLALCAGGKRNGEHGCGDQAGKAHGVNSSVVRQR